MNGIFRDFCRDDKTGSTLHWAAYGLSAFVSDWQARAPAYNLAAS